LPHQLNRLSQILLLVHVGVTQFGCPGKVLVQVREHCRELRQSFDTGIPRLFVYFLGQCVAGKTMILLHPLLGLDYLSWISCGRQDLSSQRIRVQCDRRYQLL
jgi:hypothetical protein